MTETSAKRQPLASMRPVSSPPFALGLGLTNECNLACEFCYRDPTRFDRLSLEQVRAMMESSPVRSVNLGTGENGMHPQFREILGYLRTLPIKLTITSNGHSSAVLDDEDLCAIHDIEFSLDFPTERDQDTQREPGNWTLIHEQAARCRRLGVPVTFIAVMMTSNYRRLAEVARVAKSYAAPLRVNVYQAVRSDLFALTYQEYWQGFRALFAETDVIAIGEPLVRAMAGMPRRLGGCGFSTVRVTPRATTQSCVYWPGQAMPFPCCSRSDLPSRNTPLSRKHAPSRASATPATICNPVMADVPAAGRSRTLWTSRIITVQLSAAKFRNYTSGWLPPGSSLKGESACTTIVIARD